MEEGAAKELCKATATVHVGVVKCVSIEGNIGKKIADIKKVMLIIRCVLEIQTQLADHHWRLHLSRNLMGSF